jgi:hypothetical protein
MALAPDEIANVAQAILDRLSGDDAHWTVASVDLHPEALPDPRVMLVRAVKVSEPSCAVSSYFSQTIPTQQAIAQLASSLQDEVIEAVWAAVPACEGHPHPMSARVEDERAVWGCPEDAGVKQAIIG